MYRLVGNVKGVPLVKLATALAVGEVEGDGFFS